MPIYNGLVDEGIRIVDFRHEQAARVCTRTLRGARWNARSRPANRRASTCASTQKRTRRSARTRWWCEIDLKGIANLPGLFLFDAARAVWYDGDEFHV